MPSQAPVIAVHARPCMLIHASPAAAAPLRTLSHVACSTLSGPNLFPPLPFSPLHLRPAHSHPPSHAARDFVRQCCVLLGQAQDSPLLVTVAAGAAALPTLLKLAAVIGDQVCVDGLHAGLASARTAARLAPHSAVLAPSFCTVPPPCFSHASCCSSSTQACTPLCLLPLHVAVSPQPAPFSSSLLKCPPCLCTRLAATTACLGN